jgi:adenylylsulfate kinase
MFNNVVWHRHPVDQQIRAEQKSQQSLVIWFTGIDSPYEIPEAPEVHIDADASGVAEAVKQLLEYLYCVGALKTGYAPIAVGA